MGVFLLDLRAKEATHIIGAVNVKSDINFRYPAVPTKRQRSRSRNPSKDQSN
jgi:hypothetical protein